ncbi:hypothetical protein DAPPUDRAFT_104959 [Daphnia pulex]|uniref:Ionotropic glutamate receptor C-terminal domain-containing protein n=1 Tax=Daphnia pulex TaxID=6669 RepID=E9GNY2_DAPPU|nr:hypothetical protein DAPPUDRAFT_104959 [Daphnia pulex]|eukprot:EFX78831.1 hypothetical protein DAPPUDRAFT_104959 [Daphnia pulex]
MLQKLISRLAFSIITVNCFLLGVNATAFLTSPTLSANKNFDRLNGAHLKLAVANEVDGLAVPVVVTAQRKKLMDFAYFMWVDPLAVVVPRRGEEPRLLAFFRPFQQSVWLCIMFTMVVVVCLMTVLSTIYSRFMPMKSFETSETTAHSIWQTAGECVPGSRLSFRILMGAWLLAAMVLVNSYSGTVVSYLTAPKIIPSINTLKDLAASQDVGVIVLDNTVFAQDIMEAQSGTLKILGDQVRRNPSRLLKNMLQIETLLETGQYAGPFAISNILRQFCGQTFQEGGQLSFQNNRPDNQFRILYFALAEKQQIHIGILFGMKAWEMGLPPYWMKISIQQAPKCFNKKRSEAAKKKPIGMNDLFGAFLILGVGLGLATMAFFMENFISCCQRMALAFRNG